MNRPLPYARMYTARLVLVVALVALYAAALLPETDPSALSLLVGRFHPLLVHLPIGILLVTLVLFAWTRLGFGRRVIESIPTLMHLGAWSAVVAAWAGLDLEAGGGYGGETLLYHKIAGMAVATLAVVVVFLDYGRLRQGVEAVFVAPVTRLHRVAMLVLFLSVVTAGYLGGDLTHGPDFLAEHMPGPLRALLGGSSPSGLPDDVTDPGSLKVYETLIQPALRTRCTSCHGADQAKGKLRLDTPDGLAAGGKSGETVVAGQPDASEIMRRLRLPQDHEEHMPPDGRPGLSIAQAELFAWWIESGASFEQTLADAEMTPVVRMVLEAMGLGEIPTGLLALGVAEADSTTVRMLEASGLVVMRPGGMGPFLSIRCRTSFGCLDAAQTVAIEAASEQIAWVDLAGTGVDDGHLDVVARLPYLARLQLQQTAVTDAGVSLLTGRAYLEYLNLNGTVVSDSSLRVFELLPALEAVYLRESRVSAEGAAGLRERRPGLLVDTGHGAQDPEAASGEAPGSTSPSPPSSR